jgi:hypothetical protein
MDLRRVTPTTPLVLRSRKAIEQFKVCVLCGALNVRENDECFVCRWAGDFDTDPVMIRIKINEIVSECPDLTDVVVDPPSRAPLLKAWGSLARFIQRWRIRRLDFHA